MAITGDAAEQQGSRGGSLHKELLNCAIILEPLKTRVILISGCLRKDSETVQSTSNGAFAKVKSIYYDTVFLFGNAHLRYDWYFISSLNVL